MENLVCLIITCSKYNDLWDVISLNQKTLKHKYGIETCVVTDFDHPNREVFKKCQYFVANDESFSKRIEYSLERIESKYVLLLLDDYLILNEEFDLSYFVNQCEQNNIEYLRMFYSPHKGKKTNIKNIIMLNNKQKYAINTHPSIWKKQTLLKTIKGRKLSPWEFEKMFNQNKYSFTPYCTTRTYFPFIEIVVQGKYFPKAIKIAKKYNIILNTRQTCSKPKILMLSLKKMIRRNLPIFIQRKLK